MTSDLVEHVKYVLEKMVYRPWMPGLTQELANVGWRELYHDAGLSPSNYGTVRVIARDPSVPRRVIANLPIGQSADVPFQELQVETLYEAFDRGYEESGIRFYTAEDISCTNVLEQLEEAINILNLLPSLCTTIGSLVKSVHLIDIDDDDYDVSFSEPHIPFSIFISIPQKLNKLNALRVAEAIVHEAMHLQLTLIERIIPLVKSSSQQYYSPWREELRNAQGILHGLYVFRVIGEFLRDLQTLISHEPSVGCYLERRISEIQNQISCIKSFQESEALTENGVGFTRRIITGFNLD
jgi:hypothetical protein